jgi:hypothetical protein
VHVEFLFKLAKEVFGRLTAAFFMTSEIEITQMEELQVSGDLALQQADLDVSMDDGGASSVGMFLERSPIQPRLGFGRIS